MTYKASPTFSSTCMSKNKVPPKHVETYSEQEAGLFPAPCQWMVAIEEHCKIVAAIDSAVRPIILIFE